MGETASISSNTERLRSVQHRSRRRVRWLSRNATRTSPGRWERWTRHLLKQFRPRSTIRRQGGLLHFFVGL